MVVGTGGLVAVLGCAGMGEKVMEATDVDVDVQVSGDGAGGGATRPADFPLPEPAVGTLDNTATASMGGMKVTTLIYTLPADADLDALMAPYKAKMEELGYQITEQSTSDMRAIHGQKGQDALTATASGGTLTLAVTHLPQTQ
jgi:hypothetical protein